MSDYTPKLPPRGAILDAWLRGHPFQLSSTPEDREAEFEMWEANVKAQALEEAAELAEGQDGFEIEIGLANYIGSELRHRAQQLKEQP